MPLAEGAGRIGVDPRELGGERSERGERGVVVGVGPGLAELRAHPATFPVGQMIHEIPFLVALAALHRGADAGDVTDSLAERLAAVEDEQLLLVQLQAAVDEIREQRPW